jgi:GlcNAc-P-P-Und epimerase
MKILLTGSSGFLGTILTAKLQNYFEIESLGRHSSCKIDTDLRSQVPKINDEVKAIIHAAGKAHIYPRTEAEKQAFFDVNVQGTKNLLKGLNPISIKHFVFISSVSVYGLESGNDIDESNPLLGTSPYAKSKIQAEQLVHDFCQQHNIRFLILRLPLVVGQNPLGNLGKMIQAIRKGKYMRLAKGEAKKSMVLADDIAHLLHSWFDDNKLKSGIYNLTDGYHPTFYEMEKAIQKNLNASQIISIPNWLGTILGKVGDIFPKFPVNSNTIKKITSSFTFSDKKARVEIGWTSKNVLNHIF